MIADVDCSLDEISVGKVFEISMEHPRSKDQQKQMKSYYKKKETYWSQDEDDRLMDLVKQYGPNKWRVISKYMQKSMIKCHTRYLHLTE